MNKDPRQNPHLYRQLAEMKRQIEALETELQGDGPVKRINTRAGEDSRDDFRKRRRPTACLG
jgi:hypothetical protein